MQIAVQKTLRAFAMLSLAGVLVASVNKLVAHASNQSVAGQAPNDDGNFDWLNATGSLEVTRWVAQQNARTLQALGSGPKFQSLLQRARSVTVAPSWASLTFSRMGDWVYRFTTSKQHPRGAWERSRKEAFLAGGDAHWEILVDFDALSASEHRNWTIAATNPTCLAPRCERCMVPLSDGGGDHVEWREFDVPTKAFVRNGFVFRGDTSAYAIWKDKDTLYVNQSDPEGGGHGGLWTISRGKPWSEARKVYQGTSPLVFIGELQFGDRSVVQVSDGGTQSLLTTSGRILRLTLPESAQILADVQEHWIALLGADWRTGDKLWSGGSVIAIANSEIESPTPNVESVIAPTSRQMVDSLQQSTSGLYAVIYDNIRAGLYRIDRVGGKWTQHKVSLPDLGRIDLLAPDPHSADLLIQYQSFLALPTIYTVNGVVARVVSREKQTFDARPFVVDQFQATSADGTAIPYFVVHARNAAFDGTAKTLMVGYGANDIAMLPEYLSEIGPLWLEDGGVYVVANIRGGGEFGPAWHLAAVKHDKVRAFEDFIAVGDDLVRHKITSPSRLAVRGWSSGGLLVANTALRRPDLIGAAIAEVPLLDVTDPDPRFSANTNVEERGSLDNAEDRNFLESISPFQQLTQAKQMPHMLVIPTTTDPVVNPGEARRFSAKMEKLGKRVFFYEQPEGGHDSEGVTPDERATFYALLFSFLDRSLADNGAGNF